MPTCTDGVQDGKETDIDCGGGACGGCATGKMCGAASDCASGVCTGGVCQSNGCPAGFVIVPSGPPANRSFCVAQFEMKQVNGGAVSQAAGTPWVSIGHDAANAACTALGTHAITNAEWMTVARNIEGNAVNWSGGSVGAGAINTGHSDGAPNAALSVSDTTNPFDQTNNSANQGPDQKRTHVLSNGQVLWDFAGNVYEHVGDSITTPGYLSSLTSSCDCNVTIEYNAGTITAGLRTIFGPANSAYSSAQGMGNLWGYYTYATLWRGGSWNKDIGSTGNTCAGSPWNGVGCVGAPAGIYAAAPGPNYGSTSYGYSALGFRCAK